MPINYETFKKGEISSSWEQIVFKILGDGKVHNLSELEEGAGIISPERKGISINTDPDYLIVLVNYMHYTREEISFTLTLSNMRMDGRIVSKNITIANGRCELYYMRKDLFDSFEWVY